MTSGEAKRGPKLVISVEERLWLSIIVLFAAEWGSAVDADSFNLFSAGSYSMDAKGIADYRLPMKWSGHFERDFELLPTIR